MKRATLTSSPPSPTGPPSASNITLHPQLGGPQSTSSLWYHLIYVVFGGPVMRAAGGGFPVAHAPSFRARRGEGGYGSVGVLASMRPVRVETGTGWLRGSWQPLVLGLLPPERTGPRPYFAVVVVL